MKNKTKEQVEGKKSELPFSSRGLTNAAKSCWKYRSIPVSSSFARDLSSVHAARSQINVRARAQRVSTHSRQITSTARRRQQYWWTSTAVGAGERHHAVGYNRSRPRSTDEEIRRAVGASFQARRASPSRDDFIFAMNFLAVMISSLYYDSHVMRYKNGRYEIYVIVA